MKQLSALCLVISQSLFLFGQNDPTETPLKIIPEYHFNLSYGTTLNSQSDYRLSKTTNPNANTHYGELSFNKDLINLFDKKLRIGMGLRGGFFLNDQEVFTTAHVDVKKKESSLDSFYINQGISFSTNLYFSSEYYLAKKIAVGLNVDLIGVSFGEETKGVYSPGKTSMSEGHTQEKGLKLSPTEANAFSFKNGKGSLSGQLFLRFDVSRKVSFRFGIAYLQQEFSTAKGYGSYNSYRFENKGLGYFAGLSFKRFDEK